MPSNHTAGGQHDDCHVERKERFLIRWKPTTQHHPPPRSVNAPNHYGRDCCNDRSDQRVRETPLGSDPLEDYVEHAQDFITIINVRNLVDIVTALNALRRALHKGPVLKRI